MPVLTVHAGDLLIDSVENELHAVFFMAVFMTWWLLYFALGALTGLFSGMLGIGGGLMMTPVLALMFSAQGFSSGEVLHLALGTSMCTIIFTSFSSMRAHHKHRAVLWRVVAALAPGILIGTGLGTLFAAQVPTRPLSIFFTVFVCLIAIQMIADLKPKALRELPGVAGLGSVGMGIGALSCFVAIGGGSLTVPFLLWCNVQIRQAIGTSAAVGFPIAIGGTLGYIYNGWELSSTHSALPPGSLGFVYLPAVLCLASASMICAPFGASLAHRLPVTVLKRIFAAILVLLAAKMVWSLFQ